MDFENELRTSRNEIWLSFKMKTKITNNGTIRRLSEAVAWLIQKYVINKLTRCKHA